MGTTKGVGEGVHVQLMREPGNRSVAFVGVRCVWRTCWFVLCSPDPPGMGVCPLEVASAPCSVADGGGQALERERCQSCV